MNVVIEILTAARAEMVRLLERRGLTSFDAVVTASVYLEDIADQLRRHGAPPPEATVISRDPDGYWWCYTNGMWLGFQTTDSRRGLFRTQERTIRLVSVVARPPRP